MWPRGGEGGGNADVADAGGCLGWTHVDLALGSCDRLPDVHDAFGEVVNEASSESGRQYESGRGDRTRTSPGCCICACLSRHCPRLSAIALQVERDVS